MINQATSKIVKEFSLKYSDGIIKQSLYSTLDQKAFDIIRQQFSLNESRLKHIDCPSCDNQCKIKIKPNKISFIHCLADCCGTLKDLKNNEDLAYQITLNGVADFLIKLLGIDEKTRKIIEVGEVICLGKKELENLGNLVFDIYLLRNIGGKEALLKYHQPTSKKIPAIIIKLDNKNLDIEQKQMLDCWFSDLVVYDDNFGRFDVNYKTFLEVVRGCFEGLQKTTVQKWLDERFLSWFKGLIKGKKIKRGEKETYKIIAINLFGISEKTFDKTWKEQAGSELQKQGRVKK